MAAIDWLGDPHAWASLLTLTVLEIVLGIDNLVFLSILAGRLPPERQRAARQIGLSLALLLRLVLLASITWIMHLTRPLFSIAGMEFSWRDLILIVGGLFLVYKGTGEIHKRIEGGGSEIAPPRRASFASIIVQIALLDIVFSLDSVITAVGIGNRLPVMMAAVIISVVVMMVAAAPVSSFVNRHPTLKMLALSFLLLIGTTLIADGFGVHVPRGYIYAAIGFSLLVEVLNRLAGRNRRSPHSTHASEVKMSDEVLGDRRAALEAEYFARKDRELLQRLREQDQARQTKAALAAASGITDESLLDKLAALNFGTDTLRAMSVVPLVAVAWADGNLSDTERSRILSAAAQAGLPEEEAGQEILQKLLAKPLQPELLSVWKEYVKAVLSTRDDEGRHVLKERMLSRARAVAEAAGGFLGLGGRVSVSERRVLTELEQAFSA